jgi:hypothetical protein
MNNKSVVQKTQGSDGGDKKCTQNFSGGSLMKTFIFRTKNEITVREMGCEEGDG